MSGNSNGGLKAAATNKRKFGENFYSEIGRLGGKNGNTGGFYADPKRAKTAGSLGGQHSKKGYKFLGEEANALVYLNKATNEVQVFTNNKIVEHKHFSFKHLFRRIRVGAVAR